MAGKHRTVGDNLDVILHLRANRRTVAWLDRQAKKNMRSRASQALHIILEAQNQSLAQVAQN